MSKRHLLNAGFCALVLALLLSMNALAFAQEGTCAFPTGQGQVIYDENWAPFFVKSSSGTISPEESVDLWVESGVSVCPPYQWEVVGNGYSLSRTETAGDLDKTTLSVDSGTCGTDYDAYVTVSVTDGCLVSRTVKIRNTGGRWVEIDAFYAPHYGSIVGCTEGQEAIEIIEGNKRWYLYTGPPYYPDVANMAWPLNWAGGYDPANWPPCGSATECGQKLGTWTVDCPATQYWPNKYRFTDGCRVYIWGCP